MSLKHAALGLLSAGPASGYDLLRSFQGSLANVWPATQSQLYAELGRLADAGLITVSAAGARGRKEYALTDAGLAELRHWLTEVPPSVHRRSDMLLRVFFLGLVEPDQADAYLRQRITASAEYHDELAKIADSIPETNAPMALYGRLAVTWGLRFTEMQREWAEWAVEELRASRS
jgi:DNA-binding PadR family transcriptional regulator